MEEKNTNAVSAAKHTPGPWRWEINAKSKSVYLVGGRPRFDLTVVDFDRWGMSNATMRLRDTSHDGMNLMHKLHERPDWIAPFAGREHHADWCAAIVHPDAILIAAAPDLLTVVRKLVEAHGSAPDCVAFSEACDEFIADACAAIAKATGSAA